MNDLVSLALSTKIERRTLTRTEINRRYRQRHRKSYNAYRRDWYARRKAA